MLLVIHCTENQTRGAKRPSDTIDCGGWSPCFGAYALQTVVGRGGGAVGLAVVRNGGADDLQGEDGDYHHARR